MSGSTFWPVPVASTKANLIPFGDGMHAWVMGEDGVHVVDREGLRTPVQGSLLETGIQTSELVQSLQPGRAWVLSHVVDRGSPVAKARLYVLDITQESSGGRVVLESDRIVHLREQPAGSPHDVHPDLPLDPDWEPHAFLWLVFSRSGSRFLGTVDAGGNITFSISLGVLGDLRTEDVENWLVTPVGDGSRAWLKMGARLFFIDTRAASPVKGPLLRAERILRVVTTSHETRAWVMADVNSRTDSRLARRLYSVSANAPADGVPAPLLDGVEVRQLVPSPEGDRLWVVEALSPEDGNSGGLHLVDIQGRRLLPRGPLFSGNKLLVSMTRSGRVWLVTRTGGAYLLEDDGRILAGQEGVLSLPDDSEKGFEEILTHPLGTGDEVLLWARGVFHLRARGGLVRAAALLGGMEVRSLDVESNGQRAWLQSNEDGNLYFVSLTEDRYLEAHFVLKSYRVWFVFPVGDGMHAWIQAVPASFACVPITGVGAGLALKGGALRVGRDRQVSIQGWLKHWAPLHTDAVEEGVDLDWPGRSLAARSGGVMDVTIWDAHRPESPVAQVTRSYREEAPPPRLNWYLPNPLLGEHPYDVSFEYHDELGTSSRLVVHGVHFTAPLLEQRWFRTALACLVATLFFVVPMVLLPRTRLIRQWVPFSTWLVNVLGGGGLALSGVARDLRIHFPVLVGVLCAEMILCLVAGAFSPAVFRLLACTKPFQWLVPLGLELPATRRRIFGDYVRHMHRKLETSRRQSNDERFVSMPVDFLEGGTSFPLHEDTGQRASCLPDSWEPAEGIFLCLTHPEPRHRGSVLIESAGGRGKSALLREVVRLMLVGFEKNPSLPLPVLCDSRSRDLEDAAFQALEVNPLPREVHEALLLRGDYVLVVDGLTESALSAEALRGFVEGKYGEVVRLLLTSRRHLGFQQALEASPRWLRAEPRRLDEQVLARFVSAYAGQEEGALSGEVKRACQGPDGTYLPILVRLALLFGGGSGRCGVAELYESAFRGLLRRSTVSGEEDTELLSWAGDFCLRTYWANGIHLLRYRDSPEQEKLQRLLKAGVLIPADLNLKGGQTPAQVCFFHDSMQSYLTARGLFARAYTAETWDFLWRAAASPIFATSQSEFDSGSGSELFQMCLQVFGPEQKLRHELRRQLLEWAQTHDEDLMKRDLVEAVPEELRPRMRAIMASNGELSPSSTLRLATEVCSENLQRLGSLYMRVASLLWPFRRPERTQGA
ncbi:hypothetical protein D187_005558 [Cystobacter fuscus DSM 2262]|uniref:NACHT domain-containing protein n=1 Tax=Cystobacter fuscus (strain ATCC 25194 / DSM 2262 / NBRC 100088 / M29) TaxID=1242864 RepID=S9QT00_CYSF2|nr:hypothetical protein [Cystobacter fuscus]EPX64424.1 hypothetical protein D187_005558 [Cystobacter fuscus DSM 2262]